jgi:hypothetical protein
MKITEIYDTNDRFIESLKCDDYKIIDSINNYFNGDNVDNNGVATGHVEQLFKKYLIENGLSRHIYSVFQIDKLHDKLTGNVCYRSIHVFDITQKLNGSWSRKSDKYSFPIYPYITVIVKKQHSSFFSHELSFDKSYKLQQFDVI